jgi:uncharacterized membrane protein
MLIARRYVGPTDGQAFAGAFTAEYVIDLKAKRKVHEMGQKYAVSVKSRTAAATIQVNLYARTLIALP